MNSGSDIKETADEMVTLMSAFSSMRHQINQRTLELEGAKHTLEKQNIKLAEALDGSLVASKTKSLFLATMSHEIRTPLNGILGLTELVLDSELTEQQRENLETVFVSGETLLTVLNDVLDYSKIEAGQFELSYHEFSPNDLIEHITKLFSKTAHRNGIELICDTMPTLTHQLIGDSDRLRQILINLLSNGIKFTDSGEVVLKAECLHKDRKSMKLRFSVSDTGIGISAENQKTLFASFSQIDASLTRKYGGTGLGLSIARKLVRLMGGEIYLESREHEGSRFWFDVEMEKGAELSNAAIFYKQDFSQWRILIVDDNQTNRQVLHHMVTSWGMRNGSVESGNEAFELLMAEASSDNPFHIALIDHMMPGMDGMELARLICKEAKLSELKVIMLSSLDDVYDNKVKEESGLNAFLRKPALQSSLYNMILSVMGKQSNTASQITDSGSYEQRSERVLLVEDVPTNQMVAIGMLSKLGLTEVDVAANGLEALNLFECEKYALILMDLQMPEMDGHTATQRIRALEHDQKHLTRTPIIALTAHAFTKDKEHSLAMGMDDFLIKPLTGKKLAKAVNVWIPALQGATAGGEKVRDDKGHASSTLDADVLRRLHVDMGSGIGPVIDMYVDNLPAQIDNICRAIHEKNNKTLRTAAHRLKGASRNIGALALSALCVQLESRAEDKEAGMDTMADDQMVQLLNDEKGALIQAFSKPWLKEVR